jgi:rubrerythrin
MSTQENLAGAFAGESQANRKYLAFAAQADKDGLAQIAKLFRAAAAAETIHAHAHLRAMGGIKTTAENLEAAVSGETFEYKEMYPPYFEQAKGDGSKAAEISFRNAMAVEEVHAGMYAQALESAKAGKDLPAKKVLVCDICGNTVYDSAPEKCPICGAPAAKFTEIA